MDFVKLRTKKSNTQQKYVAAVGFDGECLTQKQFDKWKKGVEATEIGIVNDGIYQLPWYIATIPEPLKFKRLMDKLNKGLL